MLFLALLAKLRWPDLSCRTSSQGRVTQYSYLFQRLGSNLCTWVWIHDWIYERMYAVLGQDKDRSAERRERECGICITYRSHQCPLVLLIPIVCKEIVARGNTRYWNSARFIRFYTHSRHRENRAADIIYFSCLNPILQIFLCCWRWFTVNWNWVEHPAEQEQGWATNIPSFFVARGWKKLSIFQDRIVQNCASPLYDMMMMMMMIPRNQTNLRATYAETVVNWMLLWVESGTVSIL